MYLRTINSKDKDFDEFHVFEAKALRHGRGGEEGRRREEREREGEMWHYNYAINFGMVCTASDDKDLLVLINTVRKTLLEFLVTEARTL